MSTFNDAALSVFPIVILFPVLDPVILFLNNKRVNFINKILNAREFHIVFYLI